MTKTTITAILNVLVIIASLSLFLLGTIDGEVLTTLILTGTTAASVLIGYFTADASKTIDLSNPKVIEKITGSADDLKKVFDAIQAKRKIK